MDGRFVPNLTMGPDVVKAVAAETSLQVDVHLMVEEPDPLIPSFIEHGAEAVAVHVEACNHLHRTLQRIRSHGARAAVALNPATPAASIRPVLPLVDQVLVMTVNPDGGIDVTTVERAAIHGARVFVTGSAFFGSVDYKRFVNEMRARLAPYE